MRADVVGVGAGGSSAMIPSIRVCAMSIIRRRSSTCAAPGTPSIELMHVLSALRDPAGSAERVHRAAVHPLSAGPAADVIHALTMRTSEASVSSRYPSQGRPDGVSGALLG